MIVAATLAGNETIESITDALTKWGFITELCPQDSTGKSAVNFYLPDPEHIFSYLLVGEFQVPNNTMIFYFDKRTPKSVVMRVDDLVNRYNLLPLS
ncbi:MAG TPA: hypothetical protein VJB90_01790 [Candidatus Nanoarchaeia archaeon]|nr:hypothetical protein [Candidatus Nanoarchaeia archaeon]